MYQRTLLCGHLGQDPVMRYTPAGTAVTNFTVAVNRKWTDQSGVAQERTTWFRVAAWDKLAELCNQYLVKGRLVLVEGEVEANAYTDQEGEAKASLELTARTVRFLGSPGSITMEGTEGQNVGQHDVGQQEVDQPSVADTEAPPF